ncbi:hypothetical protein HHI36_011830 [Cryptolaemus montrouzieri]|uniref:Reverse transcriptase domain-containing protein n=1 Tax=Cryptolaemus montrouzieri TaxID=559131 RepID=A0ABD2ND07_9CUCU
MPVNIPGITISLYADDTTFLNVAKSRQQLETKTTICLEMAERWFSENGLKLNIEKTKRLLLSPRLNLVGVTISENLNWEEHICIAQKAVSGYFHDKKNEGNHNPRDKQMDLLCQLCHLWYINLG